MHLVFKAPYECPGLLLLYFTLAVVRTRPRKGRPRHSESHVHRIGKNPTSVKWTNESLRPRRKFSSLATPQSAIAAVAELLWKAPIYPRDVRGCRRTAHRSRRRTPNGNPYTVVYCIVYDRACLRASSKGSCRPPAEIDISYQVLINHFLVTARR